ncbi:MAG TPA: hypothetical protein DCE14_05745 [Kosmotogaceae bacterium]|nr:MAG: Uncharacterized protein XE05_1392 [Thermotogales bacterium 46_20]HAA85839.1 hypothetical protein [Kosmotogaceae bacterium]
MTTHRGMRKGLTLLEVLVALTIATIVLGISLSVYNLWWRSYNPTSEKAVIERELNSAMEIIIERLRLAKEVELVKEIPNVIDDVSVFIALSNGKVEFHGNKGVSSLTGSSVSDLSFTILDLQEKLIEINLVNNREHHEDISLSSTVRVLNDFLNDETTNYTIARFVRSGKFFTSADDSPDPQPYPDPEDPDPEEPEPDDPEPEPEPLPTLRASNITYNMRGQHLDLAIYVLDQDNNAIPGASVSIDLKTGGNTYDSAQGVTKNSGVVDFEFKHFDKNAPSGTYVTVVTEVSKAGYEWDGQTPVNSYSKK